MNQTLLVIGSLPEALLAELRRDFQLLGPLSAPEDALPPGAERAEVLLTMSSLATGRGLITALPALKLVICYGSGVEFVDQDALRERGIALTNAAGANAASVAEFAMGQILASCRRILAGDGFLRSGQWLGNTVARYPQVTGLQGRRIGIYGLGEIGSQIARLAQAFDMQVGYHSRTVKPVEYRYFEDIDALAAWCDVLVIAARGTPQTYHVVNARVLQLLGPQGHLINIARGMLLDEAALCEALESGQLAGAALDVFEQEPRVSERLRRAPNAILTPHVAANTASAQQAQQQRMLDNVRRFYGQQPLIGSVC